MKQRIHIEINGAVQGVGFRPFVFRLANEMHIKGWVKNSSQGVLIEAEQARGTLELFLKRLVEEKPPLSIIQHISSTIVAPNNFTDFQILSSETDNEKTALMLPDIATCNDCLKEMFDETNRRFLYPFTNCTNCGPRFTIMESLPYDRSNTTMKLFTMCGECANEYHNPLDRRFHAQPNACARCGPHTEVWNENGTLVASHHDAIVQTAEEIRNGKIVALKGLGGFHLIVDARNDDAVQRLRKRKHREEKPLALMFPTLEEIKNECVVSEYEEKILTSHQSPIVLLKRVAFNKLQSTISKAVAPNNPYLGVMLPYTPLHHLLMREIEFPVVATSGNISDEPICIDEHEALLRLNNIADVFLVHNRPIIRYVDDSVVRVVAGKEMLIRRSRGFAPLPIFIETQCEDSFLSVGAHLKNTVAISKKHNIFISQHIGDLETLQATKAFANVIESFQRLYETSPTTYICDLHPDYFSTKFVVKKNSNIVKIQHHYAHILSCMAEHHLRGNVLGVAWDGTGFGTDETIWGGEFLCANEKSFARVATFKQFRLPGGEQAIKEPRRTAIGVLAELFGEKVFSMKEISSVASFTEIEKELLKNMLLRKIHSPITTSVGRLFDAVASILGIRQRANFEGQAAMELECLADCALHCVEYYNVETLTANTKSHIIIDWSQIILSVLDDVNRNIPVGMIASKFHNTLVEIIVELAKRFDEQRIVLSGGCFQNTILLERAIHRLQEEHFEPYWHQKIPTNDGGISLGQMYYAMNNQ
ncbi:MAG: carbamoyltransferase HypF [Ignavibacteria bacterium]|nr:carbamoyltransferase HypF [Ignavibacteria bacterium]